ncbi:MAG TPA: hypothetical protein VL551_34935 [Actinospica sp.]|jgi:hypothetical protein|nr:hypothetical protein [Actinospica sp.]
MYASTDDDALDADRASTRPTFTDWSTETTRRLCRTVLNCGPNFSAIDLVKNIRPDHQPKQHTEYETGIYQDMLSVVLAHQFHQVLLAESPDLAHELADLSYAEALHVVYHHQHDA